MIITLRWNQQVITTIVKCWMQRRTPDIPNEEDESDDESSDSEDEDEDEDANADFAAELSEAISLVSDVAVYSNELVVGNRHYPRAYIDYLHLRERQKRQPKILTT